MLKGSPLSKAVEYKNSNGERDNLGNIKTTWQFKLKNSGSNKGAVRVKYTNYYWYAPKHEKALRSGSMAGYVKLDIVAELCSADYVKHKKPLNNTLSPYFTLSKKAYAGMTRLNTFNIGTLEMKYSYYFSGTDTPAEITSNFTYLDIDWGQAMSFRADGIKKTANFLTRKKKAGISSPIMPTTWRKAQQIQKTEYLLHIRPEPWLSGIIPTRS